MPWIELTILILVLMAGATVGVFVAAAIFTSASAETQEHADKYLHILYLTSVSSLAKEGLEMIIAADYERQGKSVH